MFQNNDESESVQFQVVETTGLSLDDVRATRSGATSDRKHRTAHSDFIWNWGNKSQISWNCISFCNVMQINILWDKVIQH